MTGVEIFDNNAYEGGGVCLSGTPSDFAMSGAAKIHGNSVSHYGGGVFIIQGPFTMTGGTISGNEAGMNGGGVYVGADGTFTKSGSSTIYGAHSLDTDNIADRLGSSLPNPGHAVYVTITSPTIYGDPRSNIQYRNSTAGPTVQINSETGIGFD